MRHPSLIVLGYSEAGMFLRQPGGETITAIISIHGRHECAVEAPGIFPRLTLQFDDVEVPDPSDSDAFYRSWVRQKWAAEIGRPVTPPTIADTKSIVDFAHSIRDGAGTLLCHCQGGISRSPAAALLCLASWTGPGQERECVEQLLGSRPAAVPHLGLIRFGHELLGRRGELVRAVLDARWQEPNMRPRGV